MERMTMSEVAELCGGTLLAGDPGSVVSGLSTDSRAVEKAQIFLALTGERFDGHDFAESALKRGASGVVGQERKLRELTRKINQQAGVIAVNETLHALQLLAQRYRLRFDVPLVAVTGSCGKTTTKDMLAAILAETRETVKTTGNLNNLIGAPLMLLRIDSGTEAAVIEIASNAPGEIELLSGILSPTAGIITNVGPVHLEGFGTLDGVLEEKCSLVRHIRTGGFVVVNADDMSLERVRSMFEGRVITFGMNDSADFFASGIRQDMGAGTEFLLNGEESIRIPIIGEYNVLNALAAIAAARQFGIGIDAIRAGLEKFPVSSMRMEVREFHGATIVNDAYNANPRAMRAAISTVMAMPADRRILALGDMLELGSEAATEHRSLGRFIGRAGPDLLYLVGDFKDDGRDGALEGGMQPERVYCCTDVEEIATSLKYILRSGDLVLLKGSRGMRMERVLQLVME